MIYIINIQPKLLLPVYCVSSVHLGPASYSGFYFYDGGPAPEPELTMESYTKIKNISGRNNNIVNVLIIKSKVGLNNLWYTIKVDFISSYLVLMSK